MTIDHKQAFFTASEYSTIPGKFDTTGNLARAYIDLRHKAKASLIETYGDLEVGDHWADEDRTLCALLGESE